MNQSEYYRREHEAEERDKRMNAHGDIHNPADYVAFVATMAANEPARKGE